MDGEPSPVQGTSASGQDPEELGAQLAGPVVHQDDAPNTQPTASKREGEHSG